MNDHFLTYAGVIALVAAAITLYASVLDPRSRTARNAYQVAFALTITATGSFCLPAILACL